MATNRNIYLRFLCAMCVAWASPVLPQLLEQTSTQEDMVRQVSHDYFAAKDSRQYSKAYQFLALSDQQQVPFEIWEKMVDDFNRAAGAVQQRVITKISWYNNPPNVAAGLYCTIDFAASFDKVERLNGYLALHQEENGRFMIVREEQNFIRKKPTSLKSPLTQ